MHCVYNPARDGKVAAFLDDLLRTAIKGEVCFPVRYYEVFGRVGVKVLFDFEF